MENSKLLDYQEFYEELIDRDFISLAVDYEWRLQNEEYLKESLFIFYQLYSRSKNPEEMLNLILRTYGDIITITFKNFEKEELF